MNEEEKDFCLECGVEIFDGGSWGYCVPCGNEVFDKLIQSKFPKNVARDYVINMEPTIQSEMERRRQETEEFMYKELLRFTQSRHKAIHELDEFFNQETDDDLQN